MKITPQTEIQAPEGLLMGRIKLSSVRGRSWDIIYGILTRRGKLELQIGLRQCN